MRLVKAHSYGNDFLLVEERELVSGGDAAALARRLCDRRRGIGADGLMAFSESPRGASMRLFNADGSASEISGNGVRCLAAWLARERTLRPGACVTIDTVAGAKRLDLLEEHGARLTFRAAMGPPEALTRRTLDVDSR